jgi:hypothetical protein
VAMGACETRNGRCPEVARRFAERLLLGRSPWGRRVPLAADEPGVVCLRFGNRHSRWECPGFSGPLSNPKFDPERTRIVDSPGHCGPKRWRTSNACLSRKAGPSMAPEDLETLSALDPVNG